ncbi:MAG: Hsp20/alpha crystallin family protein [Pirellulales bacterium]
MLSRWNGLDMRQELSKLQDEMQRLWSRTGVLRHWDAASGGPVPAVNVWEDAEAVYVESELPGLASEDLEIYVTGRQLSLRGERKPPVVDKGVWHRQERGYGKFQRVVELPGDVDADAVAARFNHGVLTITLPKRVETRPRKIAVQVL